MTDRDIIQTLQESDVNNVRPEITRLKQDGIIMECGEKTCPVTGKTVRLIKLTGKLFFSRHSKSIDVVQQIAERPCQLKLII